jgi:hypothetical protein
MLFPSTLPASTPDLMRVSAFQRYLNGVRADLAADSSHSRLTLLGPSLMQDLMRFEQEGRSAEVLEVLAACIRHSRNLLIHVSIYERVLPITVFASDWLVHCPVPMEQFLDYPLSDLSVLNVERAALKSPSEARSDFIAGSEHLAPLGPLLWELALRGAREELLPEIAGNVAYRIAPGVDLHMLRLSGTLAAAVHRLQRQAASLREIATWTGFDRGRSMRMLNGLYLQAGLMVSRTHPAATNEGWRGEPR